MSSTAVSVAELRSHDVASGTPWTVISGNVYDITSLLDYHPGGRRPLEDSAGADGTDLFEKTGHSQEARKRLETMRIGTLKQDLREPISTDQTIPPMTVVEVNNPNNGEHRWRGMYQFTNHEDGLAVVSFPPPHLQKGIPKSHLIQADPYECETITYTKEKGKDLGLLHKGQYCIGALPGSIAYKQGATRFTSRWIESINDLEIEKITSDDTSAFSIDLPDLETVCIRYGGMAPIPRHLVKLNPPVNTRGRVLQVTVNGTILIQPLTGSDPKEFNRGEYEICTGEDSFLQSDSSKWHAARRAAILDQSEHQIEKLPKFESKTLPIAFFACVLHFYAAVVSKRSSFLWVVFLAYTVGAWCKMLQFAMAHEVCHNVATSWLAASKNARLRCLRLMTLPSISCNLYNYYYNHHLGHHALLGKQVVTEAIDSFLEGDEVDGDLLHVYSHLLRRQLQQFEAAIDDGKVLRDLVSTPIAVGAKFFRDSFYHMFHFGLMLFWSGMSFFLWSAISFVEIIQPRAVTKPPMYSEMADLGPQTILWLVVYFILVFWDENWGLWGIFNLTLYLSLSELFLGGFLAHPFGAYFLGVHQSAPGSHVCQPTQSCYASRFYSLITCNLTYHVEHHDFPNLPWTSLPRLREIAPDYYNSLKSLPNPFVTLYRYYFGGKSWLYACGI